MSRLLIASALFAAVGAWVAPALGHLDTTVQPEPVDEPVTEAATVELVFVLDTTSSMGGLLEGAKDTIWSMVNDFSSQTPRPELKVGIVAFRDRGDAYVTQVTPLTDDLDAVYTALRSLRPEGGGDGPESVVKGLADAVNQQPWSQEGRVFRSVFVVGDAPDKHYQDEPSVESVVAQARGRGIYVNAIQCGNADNTRREFAVIAKRGSGTFTAVAQDGAVERVATPMDGRLEQLQRQLSSTALLWGSAEERADNAYKLNGAMAAPSSTQASRLSALSKRGGKLVTSKGRGDLLDDLEEGKVNLDAVNIAELPAELAELPKAARSAEVARRAAERAKLEAEVAAVVAERDKYLADARKKAPAKASYDREVVAGSVEMLKELGYVD